ncbi:fasciculation and elongation protein zeta-2 isoform X2 [Cololabis saira]|uniref:fasciculation and elongation protein zeta-2 isoform X2 n=1 Tax=Cololabis saira TaxID=129043 RepID=UPI002AD30810|nr:fasciculation and elongation protein zeta-2 isoform X2 [Cololabis saira]
MVRAMAAPVSHLDEVECGRPNVGDGSGVSVGGAPARSGRPADQRGDCAPVWSQDQLTGLQETSADLGPDHGAEMDSIALIDEDSLVEKDELWNALSSNYGHVEPVDWRQCRTRSLYISTFSLEEKPTETDVAAELSDKEELREQLDLHSIIVPCLADEPLVTAEQVIEEIEEMMQDSSDMEAERNPSQSDLSMLSLDVQWCSPGFEERMRVLNVSELMERLEEAETTIRRFSEELVQQLAIRDELDFEKEVKNSFISALIDVQNRQKEQRESMRKKKKLKGGAGTVQGLTERPPGSYLTTVIPYEKKGHPPSIEDLQILTKILQAMRDDSDKVPSLLTDYILNVLCPT